MAELQAADGGEAPVQKFAVEATKILLELGAANRGNEQLHVANTSHAGLSLPKALEGEQPKPDLLTHRHRQCAPIHVAQVTNAKPDLTSLHHLHASALQLHKWVESLLYDQNDRRLWVCFTIGRHHVQLWEFTVDEQVIFACLCLH